MLVQEAAAGSGVSYGVLYDRYASQVYNYCLRLTGSQEDASDATQEAFVNVLRRLQDDDRPVLEFSSYLFAAARHESYALMRQRVRTHPTDSPPAERGRVADLETDPERSALLSDSQQAVREANAQLPPRHREVLALREVAGRSYEEIGATMGISENAAAQLIFRARSKLREAMTAGAVASVVATTDECETAQVLLSRVQDGQPVEEEDRAWLEKHLDECGSCKTANRMLLEIGASYRLWGPVALLAGMRTATLARAGDLVGADWSHVPAPGKGSAASSSAGGTGAGAGGAAAGAVAVVAAAVVAVAGVGAFTLLRDDDAAPADRAAKAASSASASAAKSAPAGKSDDKAASTGGKLVASRASGSRGTPALLALPAELPVLPFNEAAAPDTGNTPPDSGSPQDRNGQDRNGQDRPGQPEDGPGQPPGDGPGSDTPAPPELTPAPPLVPDPIVVPAPVDRVPADPVPPGPDPADPADPADPGNPTDPRDPGNPTDPTDPVDQVPDTQCSFPGRGTGPEECPPGHVGDAPGDGTTRPPSGLLQRLLHRLLH